MEILPITASPLYVQDSAVKASEGWLVMDVGGRLHFAQISLQEGESTVAADGLWKQSLGLGPFSPPHSRAPLKLRRRPAPARGHRGPPGRAPLTPTGLLPAPSRHPCSPLNFLLHHLSTFSATRTMSVRPRTWLPFLNTRSNAAAWRQLVSTF